MTDDRSLERAARSFIEPGPTRAPEGAVERALDIIQTTHQERDLHLPRRFTTMTLAVRIAASLAVGVIAVGAVAFMVRPASSEVSTRPTSTASASTPTPSPSDDLAQLQAYRAAVGAVCSSLASIPDEGASAPPSAVAAFIHATVARQTEEVAGLEAIQAPIALRAEHLANIQTAKDVIALLNHEIDLVNAKRMAEAATVDEATGSLNTLREAFATKYALPPCP
jgi:hypothetical protein